MYHVKAIYLPWSNLLKSFKQIIVPIHDQKYTDTCSLNISFQNHGHYYGVGHPFAAITASTLLGRLSAGTCFHSATRALVRSRTDVGRLRLGSQSPFQFIPKVFDGLEVRALCRPVKFFHTDLNKLFLCGPRFVHGGTVMLNQEKAFPKLLTQSWKHRIVKNVIVYRSIKISLHWN